jgi:hypothetical protein
MTEKETTQENLENENLENDDENEENDENNEEETDDEKEKLRKENEALKERIKKKNAKLTKGREKFLNAKDNIDEIVDGKVEKYRNEEKFLRLNPLAEENLDDLKKLQDDKGFESLEDAYTYWMGKQALDPSTEGIEQYKSTAIN